MVTSAHPSVGGTTLRVAVIGYGGAGRGIHARLVREAGHRVTAVVVRAPERRADAEQDWPDVRLHGDVASLLADRDAYDVVVVASPTALHAEHARSVISAGVPLVVDKPLALDSAAARTVVEAADAAGVGLTVFQNRRRDPEQLTLRQVIAAGELGDVHTFERRWERWRPVPRQRWKENDPVGGGLLLDLGPHLVDSATQLFGPVTSVRAELRALTTPTEDDVFLVLHHGAGEREVVSRLWAGSLVGAPGPRTRVLGTGGAYVVTTFEDDASPFEVFDDAAPEGSEGWITRGRERVAVPRAPGGHADFYAAVATWVLDAGPVPVDPWDAVRTAEVLDTARRSHAEQRTLAV
ncbi:Gfo/Idh/MocA family protein [Cellulosimicrobium arenosum]|uniref:Gfo/Idh/MocA family oxidoreductase n=1 Tax=Cellulosimicrobium arenosum TaxID=2708133 RepID=A0A927G6L6_9MICO|nr:Gfo/Idh/MocA family oxidoreductase [Cellulosimicrobium arenosum]MBD8077535.1 Gfo/Idh/MocA family oxidoreductase [Cellulosimicrobium arenosum]